MSSGWTRRLGGWSTTIATVLFTATSCAIPLRYSAREPGRTPTPVEKVAESLNPLVLTDIASRLVVEVDWVEGQRPARKAMDALRDRLVKYGPPGRPVEISVDDEIPRAKWEACCREDLTPLVQEFLDRDPHGQDGTETVYVLYAPYYRSAKGSYFGITQSWVVERRGAPVVVRGVSIYKGALRHALWITRAKAERSTLIHEFGHVLGLVRNLRHEQRHDVFHCTVTSCVMSHPTWRVYIANALPALFTGRIPSDYCRRCQEDIRRSQAYWRDRAAADPAFRDRLLEEQRAEDLVLIGSFHLGRKDPEKALASFREAAAIARDRGLGREGIVDALLALGRTEEVVAAVKEALAGSHEPEAEWRAADTLSNLGRYGDAVVAIDRERLRRLDPGESNKAWGYGSLTRALRGAGRPEEALAALEELSSDRRLPRDRRGSSDLMRSQLYRKLGAYDRASLLITEGLKDRKQASLWRMEAARLDLARGRKAEAATSLGFLAEGYRKDAARGRGAQKIWLLDREATALALAGDARASLDVLRELEGSAHAEEWGDFTLVFRTRILALTGDGEGAIDALRQLPFRYRDALDPCLDEDLETVRASPRFRELFPFCPGS